MSHQPLRRNRFPADGPLDRRATRAAPRLSAVAELGADEARRRVRETWITAIAMVSLSIVICAVTAVLTRSFIAVFLVYCAFAGGGMIVGVVLAAVQASREASGKRIPDAPREVSPRVVQVFTRIIKIVALVTVALGIVQVFVILIFRVG
jgi:hypothetical protein